MSDKKKPVGPNIGELQEEVGKLNKLLQDAHPGISTWKEALYKQGNKVLNLLTKLGFDS